jgi:hypothetical protein
MRGCVFIFLLIVSNVLRKISGSSVVTKLAAAFKLADTPLGRRGDRASDQAFYSIGLIRTDTSKYFFITPLQIVIRAKLSLY